MIKITLTNDILKKISAIDDGGSHFVSCAMPIISEGDIVGCVASLNSGEENTKITHEVEVKLIQTAASFLGKQLEA